MKTILLTIALLASTQAFATQKPCSSEQLLILTDTYIARSNFIGDKLIAVKKQEAITFEQDASQAIMLERRNLEDIARLLEQNFITAIKSCR